mmetsp:Transcript_5812/g.10697  ORF Transcript_5812/g.10697 Transcript_5812/m.10697 type:complete len:223 (+) Transcript_5812:121-789(+)
MVFSKFTTPLLPIIILQFLLCLSRWHTGDLPGSIQDGVVTFLGLAAVHEASSCAALLYCVFCALGFFYDAMVSMGHGPTNRRMLLGKGAEMFPTLDQMERILVLLAPILSLAGTLFSIRLYMHVCGGNPSEHIPLMGHPAGSHCADKDNADLFSPVLRMPAWPSGPAPPQPPLSGNSHSEGSLSPPFRAILGTPLPQSPRTSLAERMPRQASAFQEEQGAVI